MIVSVVRFLFAASCCTACISQDECVASIRDALVMYDERHTQLEFALAQRRDAVAHALSEAIIALHAEMLRGPPECQRFLEDDTLEHYTQLLNASCERVQHAHVPQEVWAKFRALSPHFVDVTERAEALSICEILVAILDDFCALVREQIGEAERCDFMGNFERLFVAPWLECAANAWRGLRIEA